MIKETKKIKTNNLDLTNLEENILSIQLSLDGFSFCIYNTVLKEIVHFQTFEFDTTAATPFKHLELIEQLFSQEELLQHKYKTVKVAHFNNLVAQVPKPFFNKENLADYLKYSVKVLENDFISYEYISHSDIVNVYIPFVNINNFLIDQYGSFDYHHSSSILIQKLLSEFKNTEEPLCFVNVTNNSFEIVILKNKKLALFNCFQYETKEDFIYYILFSAEQLNLNPEEFKLVLLGDIEQESELYTIVYQYIRNVSFYSPTEFSPILTAKVSKHSNFILLNQFE